MPFKKGYIQTEEQKRKIVETRRKNNSYVDCNKGRKVFAETRKKLSDSHMGKIPWNKGKKGIMPVSWNKGSKNGSLYSDEQIKRMSESHLGKTGEESGMWMKQHSIEAKEKMSMARLGKFCGKNHPNWKGGISENVHSPKNPRYKEWRNKVFTRDDYVCRVGGLKCKKFVQAHHIYSWRDYPKLRYEVSNGITLCLIHHPRKRSEEVSLIPSFQRLIFN